MTLSFFLPGSAQGYALVEKHVIADFRGFADHDTHPVIDEKPSADGCAGVDFYPRDRAREL